MAWRPSSVTAEDRNCFRRNTWAEKNVWRPSSVTAEDRNINALLDTPGVVQVAAVLRDGRGSQPLSAPGAGSGGGWRPSSVTAEDRNPGAAAAVAGVRAGGGRPP